MISIPFGLALVAFLLPLFSFSCAERIIAEPNAYELAMGVDMTSVLSKEESQILKDLSEENGNALANVPTHMDKVPVLFAIFAAVLVAGLCDASGFRAYGIDVSRGFMDFYYSDAFIAFTAGFGFY
jgi:hypothetical protein